MKKKAMNLTKGDIFENPNGFILVCVDSNGSGLVFTTTIENFIYVEIDEKGVYGPTNSGWEKYDASEIVDVKGCLI